MQDGEVVVLTDQLAAKIALPEALQATQAVQDERNSSTAHEDRSSTAQRLDDKWMQQTPHVQQSHDLAARTAHMCSGASHGDGAQMHTNGDQETHSKVCMCTALTTITMPLSPTANVWACICL